MLFEGNFLFELQPWGVKAVPQCADPSPCTRVLSVRSGAVGS